MYAERFAIINLLDKLEFDKGGKPMEWGITFAICFAVFFAIGIKLFWKKK